MTKGAPSGLKLEPVPSERFNPASMPTRTSHSTQSPKPLNTASTLSHLNRAHSTMMVDTVPAQGLSNADTFLASLNEVECTICEEPFDLAHAPVIIRGCWHVLGLHCLRAWVRSDNRGHNRCPTCRAVLFDDGLPLIEEEEDQAEATRAGIRSVHSPDRGTAVHYFTDAQNIAAAQHIGYDFSMPLMPFPNFPAADRDHGMNLDNHTDDVQQLGLRQTLVHRQAPLSRGQQARQQRRRAGDAQRRLQERQQYRAMQEHAQEVLPDSPYEQPWMTMGHDSGPLRYRRAGDQDIKYLSPPRRSAPQATHLPSLPDGLPLNSYLTTAHCGIRGWVSAMLLGEWPYQYPPNLSPPAAEYVQELNERGNPQLSPHMREFDVERRREFLAMGRRRFPAENPILSTDEESEGYEGNSTF
ncbi:uncharacterized protein K460DRAFT_418292 [Cucurbitaria berberidis CBS 394.84]|uniref:RING-type domain-containing protein n=1 Tax=Cucurbitaria berberidis CBS 394.84 TaxID=1168544 RepID=A0A9P4GD33_9PLEO|nr:uncharacterized protein K460DRAFT_418292 [Cucurbitaria berberidis CBS 394.84]KAF1843177.1 hypothetical protein K460DRAFT_418292 [Cucurbitaria berberidis CBS 394.84]